MSATDAVPPEVTPTLERVDLVEKLMSELKVSIYDLEIANTVRMLEQDITLGIDINDAFNLVNAQFDPNEMSDEYGSIGERLEEIAREVIEQYTHDGRDDEDNDESC